MQKKIFTKDQIAQQLGIQSYMVAAWQKKFDIAPTIENGEEQFSQDDLATLKKVKSLMYEQGLTLDTAKKYLDEKTFTAASPLLFSQPRSADVYFSHQPSQKNSGEPTLTKTLISIKQKLIVLRDQLQD